MPILDLKKNQLKNLPQKFKNAPIFALKSEIIYKENEKPDKVQNSGRSIPLPSRLGNDVTWIAPIRNKPQRFYGGPNWGFSPDGKHTPSVLRDRAGKIQNSEFQKNLSKFGMESGLFKSVEIKEYSKDKNAPYEILVELQGGAKLNINNVGYGVSQSLPLVVDFLLMSKKSNFIIQQPEVHLHPRGQAAMGDLIYYVTKEKEHSFFIETHSDFLLDRYRSNLKKNSKIFRSQVLFFNRIGNKNKVTLIKIEQNGKYSENQPKAFRNFFIKEQIKVLDL